MPSTAPNREHLVLAGELDDPAIARAVDRAPERRAGEDPGVSRNEPASKMGKAIDVMVDSDRRPLAAVIDFGGFLGVGSRPADRTQPVRVALGCAEVQAAPEYKPSGQTAAIIAPTPLADTPAPSMPRNNQGGGVPQAADADKARRTAGRSLDWLNLFVANIQTGFGPFLAVYLTTAGWTQTSIGLALSLGTVTAMASQLPAGALVDAVRSKSRIAIFSILAFTASALLFSVAPIRLFIYLGQVLHAFSSCTLGPAIIAMSLAVAGQSMLALRLGRNARYGSIGNAMGAALMGACGYYVSERAVFLLTAMLTLPAMVAILSIARFSNRPFPQVERRSPEWLPRKERIGRVLGDSRLIIFAGFVMLATLANAALIPLAGSAITKRAADAASLVIAASIVLPQLIVALISPTIGRIAEARGRRPILLLGAAMFPVRGVLLAVTTDPSLVVLFQFLDGVAAACFGMMVPLVVADVAGRSGHLNLALGFVGFAMGIGATLSTTVAGWIADQYGDPVAFVILALAGLAGLALVWLAMPETRGRVLARSGCITSGTADPRRVAEGAPERPTGRVRRACARSLSTAARGLLRWRRKHQRADRSRGLGASGATRRTTCRRNRRPSAPAPASGAASSPATGWCAARH